MPWTSALTQTTGLAAARRCALGQAEVRSFHLGGRQVARPAAESDPALEQAMRPIGNAKRLRHVLFDKEDGHASREQSGEHVVEPLNHRRRETQRELI